MIVHNVSRLVCDPERFLDPDEESMWQKGMGMYYTRASDGERMKKSPLSSKEGWQSYAGALEIYQDQFLSDTNSKKYTSSKKSTFCNECYSI